MKEIVKYVFIASSSAIFLFVLFLYLFDYKIDINHHGKSSYFLKVNIIYPLIIFYSIASLLSYYFLSSKKNIRSEIEETKKEIELLKLQKELKELKK